MMYLLTKDIPIDKRLQIAWMDFEDKLDSLTEKIKKHCAKIKLESELAIKYADKKKLIALNLPFILFFYFMNKFFYVFNHTTGQVALRVMYSLANFTRAFEGRLSLRWIPIEYIRDSLGDIPTGYLLSMDRKDILYAGIATALFWIIIDQKRKNAKKFRKGTEYGSARWGTRKDALPYMDRADPRNNVILTQTESLSWGKPPKPKYGRNKNVEVVGGSGSGKTRFVVKPNIMQMNSSYIVTDPKGTVVLELGNMLLKGRRVPLVDARGRQIVDKEGKKKYTWRKYKIKIVDTIDFHRSMHYNPFMYIHSQKDILKTVNAIIENTKGEGEKSGEDFWVKAEKLLYTALISYLYYEAPPEEQNFSTLIDLIDASEVQEENENFKNAVDLLFEDLEDELKQGGKLHDPRAFSLRQYKKYKLAAGKTAKSILISCGARLAPFDIEELREMTAYDDLELDKIGEEYTALFVIVSDTDSTFNFLAGILYTQLFNILCERADKVYDGKLPVNVMCLFDEFANIGIIPGFDKLIATIRSRGIAATIILQSKAQLKSIYKDNADTIEGNCDSFLFLGGKEKTTLKDMEDALGKETIDLYNESQSKGQMESNSTSYQKVGKLLKSQDELSVMDSSKCILQIRGVRPFFSDKYDIERHDEYKKLSDYDQHNRFDVESYVKNYDPDPMMKMKKTDMVNYDYNLGYLQEEKTA